MCVKVNFNVGLNCMSVSVYLMRGEYDSRLVWPFRGEITMQLVNHNNDRDHYVCTMDSIHGAMRVTSGERSVSRCSTSQLITHTEVESSTRTRQYIVNDCLTFRITKAVVGHDELEVQAEN